MDIPAHPQFFITRVVGNDNLPDIEILTLPNYDDGYPNPDLGLDHLRRCLRDGFDENEAKLLEQLQPLSISVMHFIREAARQEKRELSVDQAQEFFSEIFNKPIPIMNSPLAGSTLSQLATGVGGGAAAGLIAVLAHQDVGHVALYFAVIGGTRIVIGASEGIAAALKQGLTYVLLKWMGVPEIVARSRKRKKQVKKKTPYSKS